MEAISAIGHECRRRDVVRRQLKRRRVLKFLAGLKPCLVGMEKCATVRVRTLSLQRNFGYDFVRAMAGDAVVKR